MKDDKNKEVLESFFRDLSTLDDIEPRGVDDTIEDIGFPTESKMLENVKKMTSKDFRKLSEERELKREQDERKKQEDKFAGNCVVCQTKLEPSWCSEDFTIHTVIGAPILSWVGYSECPVCRIRYYGSPGKK